jgi:hypothetical protein
MRDCNRCKPEEIRLIRCPIYSAGADRYMQHSNSKAGDRKISSSIRPTTSRTSHRQPIQTPSPPWTRFRYHIRLTIAWRQSRRHRRRRRVRRRLRAPADTTRPTAGPLRGLLCSMPPDHTSSAQPSPGSSCCRVQRAAPPNRNRHTLHHTSPRRRHRRRSNAATSRGCQSNPGAAHDSGAGVATSGDVACSDAFAAKWRPPANASAPASIERQIRHGRRFRRSSVICEVKH